MSPSSSWLLPGVVLGSLGAIFAISCIRWGVVQKDVTLEHPVHASEGVEQQAFRVPATDEEILRLLAEVNGEQVQEQTPTGAVMPNPYMDTIVRLPGCGIDVEVPLGIVSKRYRLVQYSELIDQVGAGLSAAKLPDWKTFETHVWHTDLGSRAHLSIHLPPQFRLRVDGAELDLTIECLNSVERSWALRVGMGWIRGICGNGLFFGNITASVKRSHGAGLSVQDIPAVVRRGFTVAKGEAKLWQTRSRIIVPADQLTGWVDTSLSKQWGVVTAARTLHIIRSSHDAALLDRTEKCRASERRVADGAAVPGSEPPNEDLFRIAQVLAWVANRPGEWGLALERRRQIPALVRSLTHSARAEHRRRRPPPENLPPT